MSFYRDSSIQKKLTFVIVCASLLGLSLACMAFEVYERDSFRDSMVSGLVADADALGLVTAPALSFRDRSSAEEMLATIRPENYVIAAVLYDKNGEVFSEYRRAGVGAEFQTPAWSTSNVSFEPESLTVRRPILHDDKQIGSIAIVSDLSELHKKIRQYREISAVVLILIRACNRSGFIAAGSIDYGTHSKTSGDRRQSL